VAAGSTKQDEITAEQRHVDRVYTRLAQLREEAKELREPAISAAGNAILARSSSGT